MRNKMLRREPRLLITHPNAELYGSDRVLLESVAALVAAGSSVTVALPAPGPLADEINNRGAQVVYCPTLVLRKNLMKVRSWPVVLLRTVSGLYSGARLLLSLKPDALYVNTLTIPLWTILGRARGLPVVVHLHEAEAGAPRLIRKVLNAPLLLASKVISNSSYSTRVMARSYPRLQAKTNVIYNGVPGPDVPVPGRPTLEGGLRVLYVGRLSERKGVDVIIDALHLLEARGVIASLDIVGAVFQGYEWYEERLQKTVQRYDLTQSVTFHGFDLDIWPYLAAADVAVVPSRMDEPFGNTAVEALLAARPVVVSCTSGLKEAAEGYGSAMFVSPGDPSDLAAALELLVENWESFRATSLLDSAIARARNGTDRYQKEIIEVVDNLIGSARARRHSAQS